MRIAVFASALYPSLGGVEELVRELAHAYRHRGHDVLLITNRWPRSLPPEDSLDGIEMYRFPLRTPAASVKAWISYRVSTRAVQKKVDSLLKDRSIDLLHVQCVGPNGLYALRASVRLGLPLVVTTQGEITMDAGRLYQRSQFMNDVLRSLCQRADAVTAVSQKTADDLLTQIGAAPLPIKVIFNGTSVNQFASAPPLHHDRPYLSAVGRLTPEKGFGVLIEAFARSNVKTHDLLIGGSGPQEHDLRDLISQYRLDGQVHLLGRLDRGHVAALHAGADLFVLPSVVDEGFPLACIEAMSSGKAVVATRTGGIPELISDGQNGILVEKGDIASLANSIARLVADEHLRDRLGRSAFESAARLDWEAIADQYLEVFEQAMTP